MIKKRVFSLLLAGLLTFSCGAAVYADTQDEIADAQAWKESAEAGLAQTQNHIYDLEGKKQELESYLAGLNAEYEELTNSVAQLSIEAAKKEEELKAVKLDLHKAKKTSEKQYEAMKIRIAYMYEKGGISMLETLLSSRNLADFLNRAENVSQIAAYDRNMLKKYEKLQKSIAKKEKQIRKDKTEIDGLMSERSAMKQEVQAMAANTSENIQAYVYEISASMEEASALMDEISSADNSISMLVQQAAAEEAAAQAAAEAESSADYGDDNDYSEESSEYEAEESGDPSSDDSDYGENAGDDGSDYESSESSGSSDSDSSQSSSSGEGTYLGNFTLTAYCNCAKCCGTAGNLTASGTVPAAGRTVAMAGVPFGTKLLINGNVYTVEDLGTPYGHVDIFFSSHSDALAFGLQTAEVYQV